MAWQLNGPSTQGSTNSDWMAAFQLLCSHRHDHDSDDGIHDATRRQIVSLRRTMMNRIPRIIHYCWLSRDAKPALIEDCMRSWSQHMPEYEIRCWDTGSFDINSVKFVRQACEAKKWAFASDYIRLYALYHYGGIYLDSDVRVFRSFDPFLSHGAFSSVEFHPKMFYRSLEKGRHYGLGIEAAVMGAEKQHPWIKWLLDYYEGKEFINSPKYYSNWILSGLIAELSVQEFGFVFDPVYQLLKYDVHLYPPDVFSRRGPENVTRYSSHLCANSWKEPRKRSLPVRAIKAAMNLIRNGK